MTPGHLLLAYHGCDAITRDDLVSGRLGALDHSQNEYDWLGPGTYFFEGDPQRAMNFAQASADNPESLFTQRPIVTPAVVGAVICVHGCLDMTTQAGLIEFDQVLQQLITAGVPLASNDQDSPRLRRLNNQVFTALHGFRDEKAFEPYQMVRGAFAQGDPLGDRYSGFSRDGHIQVAVRDPNIIMSWFLPKEDRLMTEAEYSAASEALAAAPVGAARKPRRRTT
ncbi:hypothetical protein CR159_17640 [Pollutimonas subterranea]|uniref:Uncharacterized protein n=1 Tax=Pollutimonas subterranea TaxID=2045210 RepID=A0A2N4U0F4_9BURK|nr:hypothetical protein [Pollutimonas subterranea]PLC48503.1 hypothetical protein CR159_17640 [Pollutimonas subterranea]